MTRTSTDTPRRTTWPERVFVLAGLTIAAAATAAAHLVGAGTEHLPPLWLGALAWTVAASFAGALRRGIVRGDWSAFRSVRLPDGRGERFDWVTRTGRYAYLRIHDEHRRLMQGDDPLP